MKNDIRKWRAEASRAHAEGNTYRALKLYDRVCEGAEADAHDRHRYGELLLQHGRLVEGLSQLSSAASLYALHAQLPHAIALCKRILSLDPYRKNVREQLAALKEQRKKLEEARHVTAQEPPPPPPPAPPREVRSVAARPELTEPPAPADALLDNPLLSLLGETAARDLLSGLHRRRYASGDTIAREGELADCMYLVSEGHVGVRHAGQEVGRIRAGGFFGEISVVCEAPRTATVVAMTPTEVLRLPSAAVARLMASHPELRATLLGFVRDRLIGTLVRTSSLFQALPPDERRGLLLAFKVGRVVGNRLLMRQGDPGRGLFVLLAGQWEVIREEGGQKRSVLQAGPGAVAGEETLQGHPSAATVRTDTPCWLLTMNRETAEKALSDYPALRAQLAAAQPSPNTSASNT